MRRHLPKLYLLLVAFFLGNTCFAADSAAGPSQEPDPELIAMLKKAANESDSFKDHFEATVWLTDMSHRLQKRVPDDRARIQLLKNIHYEAARAGLDPGLVMAIIDVESNFNQFAISRVGARGLMQIMPFWLKKIGKPGDSLFKIKTNLRYGCTILKYYLKREHGNITAALARYNGSGGKYRYPKKVYYALDNRWFPQ
jgi:soluble lytic murein transglycosylase-like protein